MSQLQRAWCGFAGALSAGLGLYAICVMLHLVFNGNRHVLYGLMAWGLARLLGKQATRHR